MRSVLLILFVTFSIILVALAAPSPHGLKPQLQQRGLGTWLQRQGAKLERKAQEIKDKSKNLNDRTQGTEKGRAFWSKERPPGEFIINGRKHREHRDD